MEYLGKNVANFKKTHQNFNNIYAYDILIQMLESIEALHDKGYIHRDIKPTNFVMGINGTTKENFVFMVDYGLARIHLDRFKKALPQRLNTDFRGTLTYASLNAHYKVELSRRDDLWSYFFVILDLLNENLPWRNSKDDKVIFLFIFFRMISGKKKKYV
jgi:tau tubulin kinase